MNGDALEEALAQRLAPLMPADQRVRPVGLSYLAESWKQEDDLGEAVEFLCLRFLEEVQEDVLLETREKWPLVGGFSVFGHPFASLVDRSFIRLGFAAEDDRPCG